MVRIQRYFPPLRPIEVTSDSESDEPDAVPNDAQSRVVKRLRAQQRSRIPAQVPVVNIDESSDDGDDSNDTVIDLTGRSGPIHNQDISELNIYTIPYVSPRYGDISLPSHTARNNDVIRVGDVVELAVPVSKLSVTHLVVYHIAQPQMGPRLLVGIPLGRAREIEHWLPPKPNETCLIFEANDNDVRPVEQQALIEVEASQALRRRTIIYTNAVYPRHRKTILQRGALACRWACVSKYANDAKRREGKPRESILHHIREPQASPSLSISEEQKRKDWRGDTVRGGAYTPPRTRNGIEVVTLDEPPHEDAPIEPDSTPKQWINAKPGQKYKVRDIFCGAGGTSCGAKQAGFNITLACDADAMACQTYRNNYPHARLWETTVTDVCTCPETLRVDVLHLSPPCQFFSPAHTRAGANDEMNTAALLACGSLVDKLRPRVFTLEQTFGITYEAHKVYLDLLIRGFTDHGYSVRWQVVQLLTWGTAVQRKRLIMIGACPGEKLPPFPNPTHAENPGPRSGLKPYTTVAQVLQCPPRSGRFDKHHQPASMPRRNHARWDANKPLPTTITTSGCDKKHKGHYNGQRDFTVREVAVLQGFPWTYHFSDKGVKKQAGNAFPPPAVKTLYSHIREWLLKVDRVNPAVQDAAAQPLDLICIDDDEAAVPIIVISDERDMDGDVVVTISDSDSEGDDFVILRNERVFTASPSQERFTRESTGTLDGEEMDEMMMMGVVDIDVDVQMMDGGSEGAMRWYC